MSTDDPQTTAGKPAGTTEGESTPQQDAAYRYHIRLNKIFLLSLLGIAAVVVVIFPSVPRVVGLVMAAAITGVALLIDKVNLRGIGIAALATAGLISVVARFADEHWPVGPDDIALWAVGMGAVGVTLVFTNKKTGEANPRLESGCGLLALFLLFGVAAVVAVFGGARTVANPSGIVALEALAALAEMAGEKWKVRLALVSLLPIAALLADHVDPQWLQRLLKG